MKHTILVSLGGSVLYSDGKFDDAKAKVLCRVFEKAAGRFGIPKLPDGSFRSNPVTSQFSLENLFHSAPI